MIFQDRHLVLFLISIGERISIINKFIPGMKNFYEGSHKLFQPKPTLLSISIGMVAWLGEGVAFFIILLGLAIPPSIDLLLNAVFVLAFATILGAVSALPGGLGVAELSIAALLSLTLTVDSSTTAAATLLIRFATLWFGVLSGLLIWSISPHLFDLEKKYEKAT